MGQEVVFDRLNYIYLSILLNLDTVLWLQRVSKLSIL